jgi:hypothetical protein
MPKIIDNHFFLSEFVSTIRDKIPRGVNISNTIADILDIDKDAVYRRLRGKVEFSFTEMAMIARNLGISLDDLAGIENVPNGKNTHLVLCNQINPTTSDYEAFDRHVKLLRSIKDEPGTTILDAQNVFPHYLFLGYENITKFYLFRWSQASGCGNPFSFSDINIPDRLRAIHEDMYKYARHISSTLYVFNCLLFQRCVMHLKYYAKVRMIKEEEVSLIKHDMNALLDYIEDLAIKGKYPETGKEVSIYLSDINFDANYSCLKCSHTYFTLLKAYLLNFVGSYNSDVYNETYAWIRNLQRMSTLITVSGEKMRATFFDEQRKIIDTL